MVGAVITTEIEEPIMSKLSEFDFAPNLKLHMPRSACERLLSLLSPHVKPCKKNPSRGLWALAIHVLNTCLYRLDNKNEYLPLGWEWIRKHFGATNIQPLIDSGFLELDGNGFSKGTASEPGRCRHGRVNPSVLWEICVLWRRGKRHDTNMLTGRNSKPKKVKNDLKGKSGSEITREAIAIIHNTPVPWNRKATSEFLDHLEQVVTNGRWTDAKRKTHYLRYAQSVAVFQHLLQQSVEITEEICVYHPSFRPSYTDRVSELGGGLQACSREFRAAALTGIPHFNFDMKSSQLWILFEITNHQPLREYVAISKTVWAAKLGVDVDRYKEILYGLIFSAGCLQIESITGKHIVHNSDGTHKKTIKKAPPVDDALVREHLAPILDAIKIALDKIDHSKKSDDQRDYIENACGSKLYVSEYDRKQQLAFVIQGQEAAIIHMLTLMCHSEGIPVYSNQHDGIITGRDIPPELIDECKSITGIDFSLELKPILG